MSSCAALHMASTAAHRSKPDLRCNMSATASSMTSITGARLGIIRLYPRHSTTPELHADFISVRSIPLLVRRRGDLARLDLAAAAPEDVGVGDGDVDVVQVLVDRALVFKHQRAVRAV